MLSHKVGSTMKAGQSREPERQRISEPTSKVYEAPQGGLISTAHDHGHVVND